MNPQPTYQATQPVRVENPDSPHNGRAGSVRGTDQPGTGKNAKPVVLVLLDATPTEPAVEADIPLADLRAL